ncbi:MAG: hypothetical protein JWP69_2056 [Flaviaesturariibacter sp.]|nr:hypothetical protein [Flaviaesturariibacter sp.]
MTNKLKTAILFGSVMTFAFCSMSFISLIKGEEETAAEIAKSFLQQ